jgi:hypothetical protein
MKLCYGCVVVGVQRSDLGRILHVNQLRLVAVQASPPAAHSAAGLPRREEGVEDDAIRAIVDLIQHLGVVLREVIGRVHARLLARSAAVGSTYAAVQIRVVENWPRVAAKHLADELGEMQRGEFDFAESEKLLDPDVWKPMSKIKPRKSGRTSG